MMLWNLTSLALLALVPPFTDHRMYVAPNAALMICHVQVLPYSWRPYGNEKRLYDGISDFYK